MNFLPSDASWAKGGCFGVGLMLASVLLAMVAVLALLAASNPPSNAGAPGQGGAPGAGAPGPAQGGGPGAAGIPEISAREFTGGDSRLSVSGAFAIDPSLAFDGPLGSSDGQRTTLEFWVGVEALPDAAMTIVIGTADITHPYRLEIYIGEWVAIDRSGRCSWEIDVTETTVSGLVTCSGIPAENLDDGATGSVDVGLEFTAVSG